jgi:putative transposase
LALFYPCVCVDDQPCASSGDIAKAGRDRQADAIHRAAYVQYINRSYHRTGSLWEGRFKSSLVQAEEYLLTCMRYIELNPVRANMVNAPAQYRWSSYRHNGLGQADERITSHSLYLALGKDEAARLAEYRGLFRSELDEEALADIRLALAQGQPLGSERYGEIMCAAVGVRRTRRKPGRPATETSLLATDESQEDFGF